MSRLLALLVGVSPLGCVTRYLVPRAAFANARAIDRDWATCAKPVAVAATRARDGQAVFVRVDELDPDGFAVTGLQRAHTTSMAPFAGGFLIFAGLGFGVGAIVLGTRQHDNLCAPENSLCLDLSGIDDAIGATALGAVAALVTLIGVGVIAATAWPHRYEVAPNKRHVFVDADGTVHF